MFFRILFIVSFVAFTSAQNPYEKGSPLITNLSSSDYRGEEQNFSFIQDDKGVLFVANTIGFLEFNGAKWRHFKPDNDGVPLAFYKDDKGVIYTGGTGFIGYLENDEFGQTKFKSLMHLLPDDFNLEFVWSIVHLNGKTFFQNLSNILVYDGESISIIDSPNYIQNLISFQNNLIVDTNFGLYKLVGNQLEFIKNTEALGAPDVRKILGQSLSDFMVLARYLGIAKYDGDKIERINSKLSDFLFEKNVSNAKYLTDGNLAILTLGGGMIIVDEHLNPIYRINKTGGLKDNLVRGIYQDNDDNLWIALDNGIAKINFPMQATFFSHNSEDFGTIQKLIRYQNNLYISSTTGTYKLNPSNQDKLLTEQPYADLQKMEFSYPNSFAITTMKEKLIYGGLNNTLIYDGNETFVVNYFNSRKFYKSQNHEGRLYMGTKQTCYIIDFKDADTWSHHKIEGIDVQIRGIAEDNQGNLWLTSMTSGIYKVRLNEKLETTLIEHYDLDDGLPSMRDNLVYNIEDEKVIFGTHKGFYEYDYNENKFIPSNRFGNEYAGTDEFVYGFDFFNKDKAWIHSYRKRETSLYNRTESGYNIEYDQFREFGHVPMYYIYDDKDTSVTWFGGTDLVRFDEKVESDFTSKNFNAVISQAIIAGDSLIIAGHQFDRNKISQIGSKFKDVRFEVGATDYNNFEKNEYQFLLEGYDKDWSSWSNEPFKIYTNLNSGDYTFRVRAKNTFKTLSNEDAFKFSIAPFWFETLWFKVLLSLVTILIITYITSYFSKRKFVKRVHELELKQQFEDEKNRAVIHEQERGLKAMIQAQENERGRIARDLHDGVVQQIGSIILKARNLFEKVKLKDKAEAVNFLEELEASNQELRNISHQMMPRALKDLGMIPAISDMLESSLNYSNIKYQFEHFNISKRLPEKIEITVYRITQELINNIIKHSNANQVNVQLFKADNNIILIVEDDGIGINKKKESKGIGLLNISSRVDMVQGTVNFEPSPNSGTLVTIKIPIASGN